MILDEAYIELQVFDDPFATVDLLRRFPNLVLLRTFSKVYGLAGLRCGYALGSARFRAAVDAVRQPFSVNLMAQAAAAEAILHQDDVEHRVVRTVAERNADAGGAGRARPEHGRDADQLLLDRSRRRDDGEVVEALGKRGVIVRAGTPLGGPGHIRVTYGTAEENGRFIEALGEVL